MILHQAWRDVKREGIWVWMYTALMTIVFTFLVTQVDEMFDTWRNCKQLYIFEKNEICCVVKKKIPLKGKEEEEKGEEEKKKEKEIEKKKKAEQKFLTNEKVGGFCILTNDWFLKVNADCEYIILLTGSYVKSMGLDYGTGAQFYYTEEQEHLPDSIKIGNREIPVANQIEKDFTLFHPRMFSGDEREDLGKTMLLCCENIKIAEGLFEEIYQLDEEMLEYMIIGQATETEKESLLIELNQMYDAYFEIVPVREYSEQRTIEFAKDFIFRCGYVLVAMAFLLRMLYENMRQMIVRKSKEYEIHHLYGETRRMLERRVGYFVLLLHFIPCMGIVYKIMENVEYQKKMGVFLMNPNRAGVFLGFILISVSGIALYLAKIVYPNACNSSRE